MGETTKRLCRVTPREVIGWKSVGAEARSRGVPAGGVWAGVKYGILGAPGFALEPRTTVMVLAVLEVVIREFPRMARFQLLGW